MISSAQSGMILKIEIRGWNGEEEDEDGVGFGYSEQWSLNERVLGFKGGCSLKKDLGIELKEKRMLEVGLMQFVGCVSICGS